MKRRFILLSFFIFCSGLFCPRLGGATSGVGVTDVTLHAFSVVWVASEEASCTAKVYADSEGQQPITGLTIISESASHPLAEQNGVMKVSVMGLQPDTEYFFRTYTTLKRNNAVYESPMTRVKTEKTSMLVSNDLLAHRILKSGGSTPALGALLLVEVRGGDYPVTGWVGDDISAPWAFVDLNNLYSATSHSSLELFGGEAITLESIGGLMGFRRLAAAVPEESGLPGETNTLFPVPDDAQCTLDNAGPVIDAGQLLPIPGGIVSENSPRISATYSDQYSAIALDSVRLYLDGVLVTTGLVVSFTGVEYIPISPLSDGSHSAELWVSDEWGYETGPVTWSFTVEAASPTAVVRYSTKAPTIGAVVVTLEPSEPITVTNNGGSLSYTFTENGTFAFEFVDQAGKTGFATATVQWIVKPPRGLRIDRR